MSSHRLLSRNARRRGGLAVALVVGACLGSAPAAVAWNGDLQIRKVNLGGPSTDTFGFKVETHAYGQQTWSLLPASGYTGAPWAAKPEPDNPFSLTGAPSADGPFTRTGASPNEALFAAVETGGETPVPAPALRDWRSFRVTETTRPAGYRTSVGCAARNTASGAAWPSALDGYWGAWTATPTTAGGGDGVETTLRFLDDSVPAADRGPWTVTCTFTNTYRSRVKVLKDFVSPINDAQRVDITVNGADVDTSAGGEAFADGDASDWIAVDGGSDVSLAETGASGTVITDYDSKLECRSGTGGTYGDWALIPGGTAGTLSDVVPGRDYECRFTNTGRTPGSGVATGPPTPGATTPTGSTTPGSTTPTGTPVARASASVRGTSGCITSRYAIADVRGRGIASVTFRINGKRRTQFTRANVAGMYRLKVPASSLPRGASRVTAFVRFNPGTGVQPRLLTLAWSRCPRRSAVPPVFTG